MSYPEPPTIEAEADFKVEGAGKSCKTVRSQVLQCVSKIAFSVKEARNTSVSEPKSSWVLSDVYSIQKVVILNLFELVEHTSPPLYTLQA
jgi:hypothetical protein